MAGKIDAPKVFVSYSWTNEDHIGWVVKLSERLSGDGVHVILDKWNLREGQDKYEFMEQMVLDPNVKRVLVICDKVYADKADGRRGGVGTESQIISKEVYEKVRQEKFIPIIREKGEDGTPYLPVFFRSRIYFDMSTEERFFEEYHRLVRNIFDRPELKRPAIGTPPSYILDPDPVQLRTAHKLESLKAALLAQKPFSEALAKDYLRTFSQSYDDFRIEYKEISEEPFDETFMKSITAFLPYRDDFISFIQLATEHFKEDVIIEMLVDFIERILAYQERPQAVDYFNKLSFENYRFINYELFLYMISAMIQEKKFEAAAQLIEETYHVTTTFGGSDVHELDISAMCQPIFTIEKLRSDRLKQRWYSGVAQIVRERATHNRIRFRDLQQSEAVIYLRSCFPVRSRFAGGWGPRTLVYRDDRAVFELFSRAVTPRGLGAIKTLFRVRDLAEFLEKFKAAVNTNAFRQLISSDAYMDIEWDRALNIEGLKAAAAR